MTTKLLMWIKELKLTVIPFIKLLKDPTAQKVFEDPPLFPSQARKPTTAYPSQSPPQVQSPEWDLNPILQKMTLLALQERRRTITITPTTVTRLSLDVTCVEISSQTTPTYYTIWKQTIWLCQEHSRLNSAVQSVQQSSSRMHFCWNIAWHIQQSENGIFNFDRRCDVYLCANVAWFYFN